MKLRDARPDDYEALQKIHQQNGFDYDLPEFHGFDCVQVIVDDEDRPVMAVCARKFAEITLLVDRTWETPAWRLAALKRLHAAMEIKLNFRGFREAACWLAPEIAKGFGRRLTQIFGWKKSDWVCYRLEK